VGAYADVLLWEREAVAVALWLNAWVKEDIREEPQDLVLVGCASTAFT